MSSRGHKEITREHPHQFCYQQKERLAERLVEATSAYNTTWKTTIGFNPYDLVYGNKSLLPIEFEYNNLRMEAQLDLDVPTT